MSLRSLLTRTKNLFTRHAGTCGTRLWIGREGTDTPPTDEEIAAFKPHGAHCTCSLVVVQEVIVETREELESFYTEHGVQSIVPALGHLATPTGEPRP